jgi:putative protease
MKELGKVTHYYPKIGVAVVELKAPLKIGDKILVRGGTTNFEQTVESMQIEHKNVQFAEAGKSVGLKVIQRVREGDIIYTAT